MEIEKVIRCLAITFVVAAFAVKVATRLMFPGIEASHSGSLAITFILIVCLYRIWNPSKNENERSNE